MNKVLLIIPAYNEEANIQMVVEELRDHYPELDYVVVNHRLPLRNMIRKLMTYC